MKCGKGGGWRATQKKSTKIYVKYRNFRVPIDFLDPNFGLILEFFSWIIQ